MSDEERQLLKSAVDLTGVHMHRALNQFMRSIQNAKTSFTKEAKNNKATKNKKDKDAEAAPTSTKVVFYPPPIFFFS